MDILHRVDPIRIGEEIIYSIFHQIYHNEGARNHFGFSMINFFNNHDGLPGWNIWLSGGKGAYQLVMAQADTMADDEFCDLTTDNSHANESIIEGRFLIRYFPDCNDPVLDDFSCAETWVRHSALFDQTGTPSLTGQEQIEDSYFVVGYLDFKTTTSRDFVELSCIAPNLWKDVRIDGLYIDDDENGQFEVVAPGEIDRNIPGWNLAFNLFDKLISAFGYAYKTIPAGAVFAQKKWVRFEIDNMGCSKKHDPDIDLFQLTTGFTTKRDHKDIPCKQNDLHRSIVNMITTSLKLDGFTCVEFSMHGEKTKVSFLKNEWWSASRANFCTNIDLEMQGCCYHDH